MQVYKTRCGNIVKIESFKSLNNGKKLTRSQEKLLGLKKIKIDKTHMWDIGACLENAKLDLDMDIKQQTK